MLSDGGGCAVAAVVRVAAAAAAAVEWLQWLGCLAQLQRASGSETQVSQPGSSARCSVRMIIGCIDRSGSNGSSGYGSGCEPQAQWLNPELVGARPQKHLLFVVPASAVHH